MWGQRNQELGTGTFLCCLQIGLLVQSSLRKALEDDRKQTQVWSQNMFPYPKCLWLSCKSRLSSGGGCSSYENSKMLSIIWHYGNARQLTSSARLAVSIQRNARKRAPISVTVGLSTEICKSSGRFKGFTFFNQLNLSSWTACQAGLPASVFFLHQYWSPALLAAPLPHHQKQWKFLLASALPARHAICCRLLAMENKTPSLLPKLVLQPLQT